MVGLSCGVQYAYQARPITVPLQDGESLIVHEELGPALARRAPLVILIHGLGGDHRSPYLQRIAHRLRHAGMNVWRVDLRGSGAGISHAWRPANAGSSEDLACVVQAANRQYPDCPIHVVGFSLSGNILLKMLSEIGRNQASVPIGPTSIQSAIAVAPPIDLHDCANNMDRWSRRLYTHYYLRVLDQQVRQRRLKWPQWDRIPAAPTVRTIRQFDARYTAPLGGFINANDYYSRSSSIHCLKHIQTPTTILADRHDPIVTVQSFYKCELNQQSTEIVFTKHGGHMGYFGVDDQGKLIRWMEYFVEHQLKRPTRP